MEKTGSKKNKKLKKAIWIFIVVIIVALIIEALITWTLTYKSVDRSTNQLLDHVETVVNDNEAEVETQTQDLKEEYISYAKTIAYSISLKPEIAYDINELKKLADYIGIDEIHIFDESGTIVSGTVPEYYGYNFDSGDQMAYFQPMLEDKSLSMCQDVTPNTAEGKSMMYAIAWNSKGTMMVQVGVEPDRLLAQLKENSIDNVIDNMPLSAGYEIFALDPESFDVVSGTNDDMSGSGALDPLKETIAAAENNAGTDVIVYNGAHYYCSFKNIGEYNFVVAYTIDNNFASIVVPMIVLAIYMILVVLLVIYLLLKSYRAEEKLETANEDLQKAYDDQNAQLEEITALNDQLQENQTRLEEVSSEQEAQLDEIQTLNRQIRKYSSILEASTPRMFCTYLADLKKDHIIEVRALPFMTEELGKNGKPEEFLKNVADKFALPEFKESLFEFFNISKWQERLKDRDVLVIEYKAMTGTWCRSSIIAISRDPDGTVTEAVLTGERITEEIKIREALSDAVQKAESANTAKTSFLFNMSHDIRTPMNAIIGYTDLIEKHYDDKDKCMDYLRKTQEANKFLLSLVNNILELARIESNKAELDESVCDTSCVQDAIVSVFEELMEQKHITFVRSMDVHTRYVWGDRVKLNEIFLNLISNAYKYTPEGGRVELTLTEIPNEKPGWISLQTVVKDNGIGMSKEFLPTLFEEFSRERNATESKIQGTGLGMPIVKKLVELMGGTITVDSELGKGTTFVVTIPNRIAADFEPEVEQEQEVNMDSFKGKRILLAEDNDLNAEIAEEILGEAGFEIERAEDGVICVNMLEKAMAGYYDVILMDIQMPNMDGYKATQTIRLMADAEKKNIPIIAMTANAFEEDKRNALKAGMNGHLAKPIDVGELMKTLARVLN